MINVYAAAEALADQLTAAGVVVVLSAADLIPPAVVVNPPMVSQSFGGGADVTWTLYAVAADSGRGPALADLSDLLDKLAGLPDVPWRLAEPMTYPAGGDLGDLPAYRITVNQRLITQETTP